jgi:anti-sigma28 factor (negative regulator of flagellin synthesis)
VENMIDSVTNSIHAAAQATKRGAAPPGDETRSPEERFGRTDAVELSPAAREELTRDESMPIRSGLVERVRAEIAAGTYLTDDKLEAVVNQLHAEVFAAV